MPPTRRSFSSAGASRWGFGMESRGPRGASACSPLLLLLQTVVQASVSRPHTALLGLGLLLMLLLYVGLPGPPEHASWLWGDPNVTVLAGLTPGNSPIFYREVLPLQRARRWVLPRVRWKDEAGGAPPCGLPAPRGVLRAGRAVGEAQEERGARQSLRSTPLCPQGGGGAAPREGLHLAHVGAAGHAAAAGAQGLPGRGP